MTAARYLRLLAGGTTLALAVGVLGATAAQARPTKPGGITGLTAQATPNADKYDVSSSWNAATNATSYRVSLTKGGATLASATVTTTSWAVTVSTTPGDATLSVRAVAGHKPGPTGSTTVHLLDVTPPTGSYQATWDNNTGQATITQGTVADNAGLTGLTQTVDWGDGSPTDSWTVGTPGTNTITHTYPKVAHRYVPTVTLEDAAHNTDVVSVNAVVIDDTLPPTGSFSTAPDLAWASLDTVTVTESALSDNWSPAANITRTVDWGDGTTPTAWTDGTTLTHVYDVAGTFTPTVHLVDEAGNATDVESSTAVTVSVDSTAPVVHLVLPKKAVRASVRSWRTLHGTAKDTGGTGVAAVTVRTVEKRAGHWFGYNATTHSWLRATTKAKAFKRATLVTRHPGSTGAWSVKLAKLTRGTLVYKVAATDLVHNRSKPLVHTAVLTRR